MKKFQCNLNQVANAALASPRYLFFGQESQILIFITSSIENCWIKEENIWEILGINEFIRYSDDGAKTYIFPTESNYKSLEIPYHSQAYLTLAKESDRKINLKVIELSEETLHEMNAPGLNGLDMSNIPKTKEQAQQILTLRLEQDKDRSESQKTKELISCLKQATEVLARLDEPKEELARSLTDGINLCEQQLKEIQQKTALFKQSTIAEDSFAASRPKTLLFNLPVKSDSVDSEHLTAAVKSLNS